MFAQLQLLLTQSKQFSADYWHDCALFEAENCLKSFQAQDWNALAQNLPQQDAYWKQRCIDALAILPSAESIGILSTLCDDADRHTAHAAARTLLGFKHKNDLSDAAAEALQPAIGKALATTRQNGFFSRLKQYFFLHQAV
ncbi:MAG: hypothetical protein Q4G28_02620 [Neisseria sp.]|nr:hypothetical protein [Neisseria sp.]